MSSDFDTIYLRNLQLSAVVGPDAWGRDNKPQPVVLSLRLCRDTLRACVSDQILDTFSYGQMCKEVTAAIDGKKFPNLDDIVFIVEGLSEQWAGESLHCHVTLPKGLLRVHSGLSQEAVMQRLYHEDKDHVKDWRLISWRWRLRSIRTACIIGVNPHERYVSTLTREQGADSEIYYRLEKQTVSIDLCIPKKKERESDASGFYSDSGYKTWSSIVRMTLEASFS